MPEGRVREVENEECRICSSNVGTSRISPGLPIFLGRWWRVEHAYPSALPGWLVIVLERHAEALHELTELEAEELGRLQLAVAKVLRAELDCAKEYALSLGEGPGFSHLHFHMVPRARSLQREARGVGIFQYLNAPASEVVMPESVAELCRQLRDPIASVMGRPKP